MEKRDLDICEQLRNVYYEIMSSETPIRVTSTLLAKRIGKDPMIRSNASKLPISVQFLNTVSESVEQFQIRRVDYICKKIYEENGKLIKWKVIRLAGLGVNISREVGNRIDLNINYNNMCTQIKS